MTLPVTVPADDPRRYEATLLVAGRLRKRPDAPLGIAGSTELGAVYVAQDDPDVKRLLRGLRRSDPDELLASQTWPDADALRVYLGSPPTSVIPDARLDELLAAAIADVTSLCTGGFGIA